MSLNPNTLTCMNFADVAQGSLSFGSLPNMIPFMWRNPHHSDVLRQWFGTEEAIYRAVVLQFLPPSAPVQRMMDEWRAKEVW